MLCVFILCVCVCEGFYCVTLYVYLSVCLLWATMPEIKWLDWIGLDWYSHRNSHGLHEYGIQLFTVSNWSLPLMLCSRSLFCGYTIHRTTKVSEEVNRKCHAGNTTVQLLTPYTDPESYNAQHHRETYMERWHHHAKSRSHCVQYWILKNCIR